MGRTCVYRVSGVCGVGPEGAVKTVFGYGFPIRTVLKPRKPSNIEKTDWIGCNFPTMPTDPAGHCGAEFSVRSVRVVCRGSLRWAYVEK